MLAYNLTVVHYRNHLRCKKTPAEFVFYTEHFISTYYRKITQLDKILFL